MTCPLPALPNCATQVDPRSHRVAERTLDLVSDDLGSTHINLATFFLIFFFVFLPFLGLLPWHMKVPRLGV